MDVESLLQTHTLAELKDIEKKLRTDVERKKEDLRELVSVRYRDLIDAADKITGMHNSIVKVTEHLRALHLQDQHGRPRRPSQNSIRTLHDSHADFGQAVATLLQAAPEAIFVCLDNEDPLTAAVLFALARNAVWQWNTAIPETPPQKEWIFLRAYGDFIYQNALSMFEKTSFQPGEMLNYFCSVMLLKTTMTRLDILEIFISKRTNVLHQLLTLSSTFPVKESVELTFTCIFSTISAVHEIFNADSVPNYMLQKSIQIRNSIFSSIFHDMTSLEISEIYNSVINSVVIDAENSCKIAETVNLWISEIPQKFSDSLYNILGFIVSFQALFVLKKSLDHLLSEQEKSVPSIKKLSRDLGLSYVELIKWVDDAIQARFGNILREKLAEVWEETLSLLTKEIANDSKSGLEPNFFFTPALAGVDGSGKFIARKKFLGKTQWGHLTPGKESETKSSALEVFRSKMHKIFADIQQISGAENPHLHWIQDISPVIFLDFLHILSSDIKKLVTTPVVNSEMDYQRRLYFFLNSLLSQRNFPDPIEITFHKELNSVAEFIFSSWLIATLENWRRSESERLLKELDPIVWSLGIFPFQKVSVEELNESGEKASYVLNFPSKCSLGLFTTLQELHEKLIRFGKGIISDSGIQKCYETICSCYEEFLKVTPGKLVKNQAIQLVFDLKFVQNLGRGRKGFPISLMRSLQNLIDQVAAEIDPIDYNALLPYLDKNAAVFVLSIKGLFFWFSNMDGTNPQTDSAESLKASNAGLILPKSVWFSQLPLSVGNSQK